MTKQSSRSSHLRSRNQRMFGIIFTISAWKMTIYCQTSCVSVDWLIDELSNLSSYWSLTYVCLVFWYSLVENKILGVTLVWHERSKTVVYEYLCFNFVEKCLFTKASLNWFLLFAFLFIFLTYILWVEHPNLSFYMFIFKKWSAVSQLPLCQNEWLNTPLLLKELPDSLCTIYSKFKTTGKWK